MEKKAFNQKFYSNELAEQIGLDPSHFLLKVVHLLFPCPKRV